MTFNSFRFAESFRVISWLGSAFMTSRLFGLWTYLCSSN